MIRVAVRSALERRRSLHAKPDAVGEPGELFEHALGRESVQFAYDIGQLGSLGLADVEYRHQLESSNLAHDFTLERVVLVVLHWRKDSKRRLLRQYLMAEGLPGLVARHARGVGLLGENQQHVVRAVARKATLDVEVLRPAFAGSERRDALTQCFE